MDVLRSLFRAVVTADGIFLTFSQIDANVPEILLAAEGRAEQINLQQRRASWTDILVVMAEIFVAGRKRIARDKVQGNDSSQAVFFVVVLGITKYMATADASDEPLVAVPADFQVFVDFMSLFPGAAWRVFDTG